MTDKKGGRELVDHYASIAVASLTSQEEMYVNYCIRGLNPSAAARSAGYRDVVRTLAIFSEREDIQLALAHGREVTRQLALQSGALDFTRNDATRLYLEAHSVAETAAERIRAVDSLVKLHGLSEPEKKELTITSKEQLRELDTDQLMKMAGSTIQLDPSMYTSEVKD